MAFATRIRPFIVLATLTVLAAALPACGGSGAQRSAEAYCRAFYETEGPLHQTNVNTNPDKEPLEFILTSLGSPGHFSIILNSMVDHAPDQIKADTETVRNAIRKEQRSLGQAPLNTIGDSRVAAVRTSASVTSVDSYLKQYCPVNSVVAEESIIMNATK